VLLQYYKALWKGEPSPYADKDVAIAFFKKYKYNTVPSPYNVPIVNIGQAVDPTYEDSIEVVTILKAPADLTVNNKTVKVKPGIASTRFTMTPGKVNVGVARKGKPVLKFVTPEGITEKPYRTDRLLYSFSSECPTIHKLIFGDKPMLQSNEY
jgi:hypothetical protein